MFFLLERCTALGQVYQTNAPCQQGCYGEQYCPPPGGACVCPSNELALPHNAMYRSAEQQVSGRYNLVSHDYTTITCYSQVCPSAKFMLPGPGEFIM